MNWVDYFEIEPLQSFPCPNVEGWSYHYFNVLAKKEFTMYKNLEKKEIGIIQGHTCGIVLQMLPLKPQQIATNMCWYGQTLPPIEFTIHWLQCILNGTLNIYQLCRSTFDYVDYYAYSIRTFDAIQTYLGEELFKDFFYGLT